MDLHDGLSLREVARRLGCSRPTALVAALRAGVEVDFDGSQYRIASADLEKIRLARVYSVRHMEAQTPGQHRGARQPAA